MSLQSRPLDVANYVETGRQCLDQPPAGFVFDTDLETAFIERINQERAARGLDVLTLRLDMRPAARYQSLDMGVNAFFGHDSPDGRNPQARIAAFDRTMIAAFTAENVAKEERVCEDRTGRIVTCRKAPTRTRADTLNALHQNLMESQGHRENILSPYATHIALGVARRGPDFYVTQLFAAPAGVFDQPFPLQVRAGSRLDEAATLTEWEFANFAIKSGDLQVDLNRGLIPPSTRGNITLQVRGERKGEPKITAREIVQPIEYIYFPGPAVAIASSKGS